MESHLRGFNLPIKIAHLRTYFIVRGVCVAYSDDGPFKRRDGPQAGVE